MEVLYRQARNRKKVREYLESQTSLSASVHVCCPADALWSRLAPPPSISRLYNSLPSSTAWVMSLCWVVALAPGVKFLIDHSLAMDFQGA
jgi:hypothetical protein